MVFIQNRILYIMGAVENFFVRCIWSCSGNSDKSLRRRNNNRNVRTGTFKMWAERYAMRSGVRTGVYLVR
jgi:hypothetical protein